VHVVAVKARQMHQLGYE